uniref:ATP synthase F0 subunit 8 n=1 Tax=Trachypeplus jacobsoni TaxID=2172479 RepID=A0A343WNR5_9HEMI|nr:ATP synthase F0 subunit 8 [Trachypeplus jacobsoni]AWD31641.1 ATP synthase F0 subunit 8 [Trachypeplus jacobsoni]
MPQMAPMWWTMINLSVTTIIMVMVTLMFFQKNYMKKLEQTTYKTNIEQKNWKW